jgi:hypothetical protein
MLFAKKGSGINSAIPFVLVEIFYALCVVGIVVGKKNYAESFERVSDGDAEDTHVELPSIKILSVISGVMLAYQTRFSCESVIQPFRM